MKGRHSLASLNDDGAYFENDNVFEVPKIKKIKLKTRGTSSKQLSDPYQTNTT